MDSVRMLNVILDTGQLCEHISMFVHVSACFSCFYWASGRTDTVKADIVPFQFSLVEEDLGAPSCIISGTKRARE